MDNLSDIVALSAVRTPIGRFGGTLRYVPSFDLGAVAIRQAVQRAGVPPEQVDEVILGSCRQAGNGPNPGRTAAVRGGIPIAVPVSTINMACPSGMKTVALAAQSLRLGEANIVIAGGFDSMSTIPYLLKGARWDGLKLGDKKLEDGWSDSVDPLIGQGMGETAENLFDKYGIPRQEQDVFAAESHGKASHAQRSGWFKDEIVPVDVPPVGKGGATLFEQDETIRHSVDPDKMKRLPPVFRKGGTVTAGNTCQMSDGACALVLTSRETAKTLGVAPLFSMVSYSQMAVDPATMGEGPALTIPAALQRAQLTLADMDLIEVNEAFAIQVLANEKALQWDRDKLNVHGGAIALGHPTGISGARILVTLYYALKRLDKTLGIASICGGGGVSMAMVIRREV